MHASVYIVRVYIIKFVQLSDRTKCMEAKYFEWILQMNVFVLDPLCNASHRKMKRSAIVNFAFQMVRILANTRKNLLKVVATWKNGSWFLLIPL